MLVCQIYGNLNLFHPKKWLRCTVNRKLSDQYIQMWSQFKGTSSKANMYFSLKNEIKLENYLTIFTGKIRNSICRFRTANHRLAVEVGRWIGKDYDQCFCTLCGNNKIGDEHLRLKYIPKYFWNYPSTFKFTSLINTDNTPDYYIKGCKVFHDGLF